jgi:hypothetical protein
MAYKYQLAKRGKWICPQCEHKTFVLYVDANGEPLNPNVGKCDRADNCAYHYPPKQYFADNGIDDEQRPPKPKIIQPTPLRPSYIDAETLKATLQGYEQNRFVAYLKKIFGNADANRLVSKYYIGSSNHWHGANVFWQIDRYGNIHTGKIMLYNPETGKRVKRNPNTGEPRNYVSWVHTVLNLKDYNLVQCLFGEHLLKDDRQSPVVIVESEKTAIICSRFVPDAVWLACGGCQNLSKRICEPLHGRDIILMPDNGKFGEWAAKGRELMSIGGTVRVSDLMEWKAAAKGDDICDLLIEQYTNGTLNQSVFDNSQFHRLRN